MKTVQRYYMREFLKILAILTVGISVIFSLLELFDKIDEFMPSDPSFVKLLEYTVLNVPKYFYYLLPMSLLICSLFIFSQASRQKELTAVMAIGGRLRSLFVPFLALGVLISVFDFMIGEVVIPDFAERAHELKYILKKKEKKLTLQGGTIWMKGDDGSFVRIELFLPERNTAENVSIFTMKKGLLTQRIEAPEAEWTEPENAPGVWKLKNAVLYDTQNNLLTYFPEMDYSHLESPDFFSDALKKPEDMGIVELRTYIKKLKSVGFSNEKLYVDLQAKLSYPFMNFFLIILGFSLSVSMRMGSGMFAAGVGLFISFVYWLGHTFLLSMGYAGILPPVVAAWSMPLVFGTATIYLYRKIPE